MSFTAVMTLCGHFFCLLIATSVLDLRTCFLFCKIYSICGLKSILETRRLFVATRRLSSVFDRRSRTKLNIFYIVLSSIWITWNSFWVFYVCLLSYIRSLGKFDRLPIQGDRDQKAGDGDPKTRIKGDKCKIFYKLSYNSFLCGSEQGGEIVLHAVYWVLGQN